MKPTRNPRLLAFIRTLPCCVCGSMRNVEAAHTGPRGLAQKADDSTAIPLCNEHHDRRRPLSIHTLGPVRFQEVHRINIWSIVAMLQAVPKIRPDGQYFVGYYLGDHYVLSPIAAGVREAVHRMVAIRKDTLRTLFTRSHTDESGVEDLRRAS